MFKITSSTLPKTLNSDNPPIRIYVNEIENRIIVKVKTDYYLELITTEIIKLLGSTKSRMTKNKNGKNVTHLEIAEGVLDYCNVINNDYQNNSTVFCIFVPNKCLENLLIEGFLILKYNFLIKILNS